MAPPTVHHLSPGRLVLGGVAVVCAVVLLGFGVARIVQTVKRSVDESSAYRLSYRDLDLDPPPPRWFRGGSGAFLERVLGGSDEFRSFSALNFDAEHLRLYFRHNPLVEKELGVFKTHPNRVSVRLHYREPVAVERLEDGNERTVIDQDGVILPPDEIEPAFLGTLVRLCQLEPPADPKAGEFWNRFDPKSGPGSGPRWPVRNERVREAARLAAFLRERLAQDNPGGSTFPRLFIHAWGEADFYIQVGANLLFHWDEEGQEERERLTPEARWGYLRDFTREHPPKSGEPATYWKFTTHGIEPELLRREPKQAAKPGAKPAVRRTGGSAVSPQTHHVKETAPARV
jgi:hypothetical protein